MKLIWIGLTQPQSQTLLTLIDQEIDEVDGDVAPEESEEYVRTLKFSRVAIQHGESGKITDLKAEIHSLKNRLQAAQLENALKEKA